MRQAVVSNLHLQHKLTCEYRNTLGSANVFIICNNLENLLQERKTLKKHLKNILRFACIDVYTMTVIHKG